MTNTSFDVTVHREIWGRYKGGVPACPGPRRDLSSVAAGAGRHLTCAHSQCFSCSFAVLLVLIHSALCMSTAQSVLIRSAHSQCSWCSFAVLLVLIRPLGGEVLELAGISAEALMEKPHAKADRVFIDRPPLPLHRIRDLGRQGDRETDTPHGLTGRGEAPLVANPPCGGVAGRQVYIRQASGIEVAPAAHIPLAW